MKLNNLLNKDTKVGSLALLKAMKIVDKHFPNALIYGSGITDGKMKKDSICLISTDKDGDNSMLADPVMIKTMCASIISHCAEVCGEDVNTFAETMCEVIKICPRKRN